MLNIFCTCHNLLISKFRFCACVCLSAKYYIIRSVCDFVIWILKGLLVIRVKFNEIFWKKQMLPKLMTFFKEAIVSEALTERFRRGILLKK